MTAIDNYTMPPLLEEWYDLVSFGGFIPGRNDMPGLVWDHFCEGGFAERPDFLAVALECAWTGCEFPMLMLGSYEWTEMFFEVGFIRNGAKARRPRKYPRLYRAAIEGWQEGMSWTDDLDTARQFLARRPGSTLWTIAAPVNYMLIAQFHGENNRGEHEWVLDPESIWGEVEPFEDGAE